MAGTKSAARYATALLELADEQKALEKVYADMVYLHQLSKENKDFQLFLKSPIIAPHKKNNVFMQLFESFHSISLNFVHLMTKNKRENILSAISANFIAQYKVKNNIVPVTIVSAKELSAKVKEQLMVKIKSAVSGTIELIEKTDASLLGGFVIYMNDKRIDASIASRFINLKQHLAQ
jgi:F-type H+-transporting ATPase subunit delta